MLKIGDALQAGGLGATLRRRILLSRFSEFSVLGVLGAWHKWEFSVLGVLGACHLYKHMVRHRYRRMHAAPPIPHVRGLTYQSPQSLMHFRYLMLMYTYHTLAQCHTPTLPPCHMSSLDTLPYALRPAVRPVQPRRARSCSLRRRRTSAWRWRVWRSSATAAAATTSCGSWTHGWT